MKFIRFLLRFIIALIIAIGIIIVILWASGNIHLVKAVRSTYLVGKTGPTIEDNGKFENRIVAKRNNRAWPRSKFYNQKDVSSKWIEKVNSWETVALFIIQSDSILFEQYWDGYSKESYSNSFSMAKSFTSLAIGAAIKDGYIKSVDQMVGEYIDEFKDEPYSSISIKDLLTMSSGIDFGESYGDPFGFMAKTYYGTDLYDLTISKKPKHKAGKVWHYQGGNSLLLSFVLKQATNQSISDYFSENIWQKIEAEKEALWTLNKKDGIEKSYCCFYSNVHDFAKVGQLMLDSGMWNGEQIIPKNYYLQSLMPVNIKNESGKNIDYYGFQWWFGEFEGSDFYYARGIQGQYIVWVPSWDLVLVRLGHKRDPAKGVEVPKDLFDYLNLAKEVKL